MPSPNVPPADIAPVLTIHGIGKTYVEPVLADVSLHLRPGEVLALTGENGAGKSTLSKIIGGLAHGDAGTEPVAHAVCC
jgi:ribose transport system ATP-binding protein